MMCLTVTLETVSKLVKQAEPLRRASDQRGALPQLGTCAAAVVTGRSVIRQCIRRGNLHQRELLDAWQGCIVLCRLLWQILTDASLAGSPILKVGLNRMYGMAIEELYPTCTGSKEAFRLLC